MRRMFLLVALVTLVGCSTDSTSPAAPEITPSFEEQHSLPHAGPCHAGETETQGVGGRTCTQA